CEILRSRLRVADSLAEVGGDLYFGTTKTHRQRIVMLPAFLRDLLAEHLTGVPVDPDALVFTLAEGGPLRQSPFWYRVWNPARSGAGFDGLKVHEMRHTCAALLIAKGAHAKAIQEHLGHSTIAVTMDLYGHLFPD